MACLRQINDGSLGLAVRNFTFSLIYIVIQICNVKPLNENNVSFQGINDAPEKIASYYEVNDVCRFQLDRPVHRGPVDKDNEFKVFNKL